MRRWTERGVRWGGNYVRISTHASHFLSQLQQSLTRATRRYRSLVSFDGEIYEALQGFRYRRHLGAGLGIRKTVSGAVRFDVGEYDILVATPAEPASDLQGRHRSCRSFMTHREVYRYIGITSALYSESHWHPGRSRHECICEAVSDLRDWALAWLDC